MREVVFGDGYGSQNSARQHFGLGEHATIDQLVIKWPKSGITQTFNNVATDRIVAVTEGRDELVEPHHVAGARTKQ
jgi:enediyne biosynthesis protein E4